MNPKRNKKICDFKANFAIFEIKIIKLATSRPRHFLSRHL
jgi:hypothetical protein